jgi:hypothetical protein
MRKIVSGFSVFVGSCVLLGTWAEESQALPSFRWSQAGAIPGMTCVRIHEDADPHAWSDNFLCSNENLGLRWSQAGAISGMSCTRVHEDADPAPWGDNFLCAPSNASFALSWTQAGTPREGCTRIHEDADPHAWSDNFLCVGVKFPLTGNRDDAVANGRMGTSFTLTNGGRLTAVTNTRTGVRLAGFTGAVGIVLLDSNRQPIWASDTQSYGVDGCTIGRCNRNDNWSATVPADIMQRVRGYTIIHRHNPTWLSRVGARGDQFLRWLSSEEGQGTVGAIVAIAVML